MNIAASFLAGDSLEVQKPP